MQQFDCPSCGGTLEYDGKGRTVKCPYCGTVAEVPATLWQAAEAAQLSSQGKKWLIIFLVVTVVLPTCLGIAGTVAGIGAGIVGAILPFLLSLLGR